jgi:mannose-6-phosphate isomerase-like protein (cupin superfamily)
MSSSARQPRPRLRVIVVVTWSLMEQTPVQPIALVDEFVHLAASGAAFAFAPAAAFWRGEDPTEEGRTLGAISFTTPDDLHHRSDERHPGIDEVIIVAAGQIQVGLDRPSGPETVTVSSGSAVIVPADTWHRLDVVEPGWMIFCNRRRGIASRTHPSEGPP